MKLKDLLKEKLTPEEMNHLITTFEIVGDIAVIEVPPELEHRKHVIGNALMEVHKSVKTVLRELSERKGPFRVKDYEIIAGEPKTETIHREYGCRYALDLKEVYFSPREATERGRILKQVKDGENVMVFFAGVGPYAIILAKHRDVKVTAIELNPKAVKYMRKNVRMNKVSDRVDVVEGDVRSVAVNYYGQYDRVLMPLPKGAHEYIGDAIRCLKRRGVIHFYHWAPESDLFSEAEDILRRAAEKYGRRMRIMDERKVLPYAPGVYKICVDAEFWMD
ncbi:MAG: class I SAM-dependent methyltransferase family protein [Candidatus Aenigmatarchaeota archaeon]|nr:MAG: class I SAM-dependent methyltransferase family protein [Candidatus Aenigmarchaeota archaeon]